MSSQAPAQLLVEVTKKLGFKPAIDGFMSAVSGRLIIDPILFDKQLDDADGNYSSTRCSYKGKPGYSMNAYLQEAFGEETLNLVKKLL